MIIPPVLVVPLIKVKSVVLVVVSASSNSVRSPSKTLTPVKDPVPNVVLKYTSPWLSSLKTGSTYRPEDRPRSKYCLAECKNVVVAVVLSNVVAALSKVISDDVTSNSSDVIDLIVSTA